MRPIKELKAFCRVDLGAGESATVTAGYMFQAYLLKYVNGPGGEGRESEAREAAGKALALADTSPDWERHFLRGVYHHVNRDCARSMPEFDTAVRLRLHFEPAAAT